MALSRRSSQHRNDDLISKVPQVTVAFWIIKILATTVGETGGDALSMSLQFGYAVSSLIFLAFFCVTLTIQVKSKHYHPFTYWSVVIATTTVGTTMSDFLDRTLKFGYVLSSIILFCGVLAILLAWYRTTGKIEFENISTRQNEIFYWVTILVSNTLGTALGDFVATDVGLGFGGGAIVFSGLLVIVILAHFFTNIKASLLFWSAYILTRPLGATLGDTITKPHAEGGFELNRITASLTILALMIIAIVLTSNKTKRVLGFRVRA
ncbi:MAG: hypothetical protein DCF22_23070 [Leptolyngbya sp.]|nr:MAG: hypothetical protein DCF22_23070 [Leptolyngbya sp.]